MSREFRDIGPDEPDFKRAVLIVMAGSWDGDAGSTQGVSDRGGRALARRFGAAADDAEGALRHREFMTEMQALRELIEPRAEIDRDALERARAQIAEAQAYKHELGLIYAAVERTRDEMSRVRRSGSRAASTPRAPAASLPRSSAAPSGRRSRSCRRPRRSTRPPHTLAASLKSAPRAGPRPRHPGPRGADFRGLQFPGPHRPARRPRAWRR